MNWFPFWAIVSYYSGASSEDIGAGYSQTTTERGDLNDDSWRDSDESS